MDVLNHTTFGLGCKKRRADSCRMLIIHRSHVAETGPATAEWFDENPQYTGGVPPYHFYIRKDGMIDQLVKLSQIAQGAKGANQRSIQIALAQDLRKDPPTLRQGLALVTLCVALSKFMCNVDVKGHDEIKGASSDPDKQCPGEHLSMDGLRSIVKDNHIPTKYEEAVSELRKKGIIV